MQASSSLTVADAATTTCHRIHRGLLESVERRRRSTNPIHCPQLDFRQSAVTTVASVTRGCASRLPLALPGIARTPRLHLPRATEKRGPSVRPAITVGDGTGSGSTSACRATLAHGIDGSKALRALSACGAGAPALTVDDDCHRTKRGAAVTEAATNVFACRALDGYTSSRSDAGRGAALRPARPDGERSALCRTLTRELSVLQSMAQRMVQRH